MKGKRVYYVAVEESNEDFDNHEDEVIYIAIKDESDEDETTTNVCSNQMTGDKSKFNFFVHCDGNIVRFGNDVSCLIKGKESIKLIDKIICDNCYYVKGLN